MKNTFKYLLGTLALAGTMVACSPEEFEGMDASGIQLASQYADKVDIQVDQNTNQVTMTLNDAKAVYPYWEIETGADKKGNIKYERSTVNGYKRIFATAGDYKIKCYIGNHDGISEAAIEKSIHINNTIVDFTPYLNKLAKGPWFIDNEAQGHMGCGPSGTDGTEWWSAAPNDKASWGVYDNFMTFTVDKVYTFDPGASGTVYVNNGVSMWPDENVLKGDDGSPIDFTHKVDAAQVTTYELEVEGSDLYIVFPEHTYFPYIANDDIWNTPRYRVVSIDSKSIELVIDNSSIAWHYLLTNSKVAKFNGFTYNQADNIWKNIEVKAGGIYYADGSWSPYPDNGGSTFTVANEETTIVLPMATASQWQAQFPIHTNVGPGSQYMNSNTVYDFSCIIRSNKDLPGMTLKLVETGDNGVPGSLGINYDANAVFAETVPVPGGEDYVFYLTEKQGVDIQDNLLQLVLDFGGNAEGTEVTIKNIVLIDHSKNTELDKIPSDEPGSDDPDVPQVDWSGKNLLEGMPIEISQYYAPGWSQIADAEYTAENGVYNISYPSAAGDQWQAQFTFNNTGIALDPSKTYDFRCKLVASNDHPGVTIKLTQQDDDNTFLTDARHALVAYEETWIEMGDLKFIVNGDGKGVIDNLKIPFDFGGIAAGTDIVISDMHLQEHQGPKVVTFEDADNLWKTAGIVIETYNAQGGDWHTPDPALSYEDNGDGTYSVNLPSASDNQWQAQFKLLNTVQTSAANKYDFRVILNPTKDVPQATVKWVLNGDDSVFYTDARHDLEADKDNVIVLAGADGIDMSALSLVLDFGGNAAETEVEIKGIAVQISK